MSSAHSSRMPSLETSVSPLPSSSITETPSATQSKHDEQTTPTPESPSTSVSRKRPAVQFDLTTEEEKRYTPRPGRHQSRTDSYDSSVEPCNCPPEAKIPRPRNGMLPFFISYLWRSYSHHKCYFWLQTVNNRHIDMKECNELDTNSWTTLQLSFSIANIIKLASLRSILA